MASHDAATDNEHGASKMAVKTPAAESTGTTQTGQMSRADRYRGATVEDLDPPPALSCQPTDPISRALLHAYERDYTHLTVVTGDTRALLGYLSIPRLKALLQAGTVLESDPVERAMLRFRRHRDTVYRVITMATPLEDLEAFFAGEPASANTPDHGSQNIKSTNSNPSTAAQNQPQDFAVVTDDRRRFVLGVVTSADLDEFVRRRPSM